MGTRHQIYIITKVLGRYRIVAVYHLQYLYPPDAVHLAWTLLQHVKKHAGPFEKELQCLQQSRYYKNNAAYPCPFLGAALFQRIYDLKRPYSLPLSAIDSNPWYQDNNSGFTVIDVTDPSSPAYCFWGLDGDNGFRPGYPIDPEGYVLRYFNSSPEEDFESLEIFKYLKKEVQDAILDIQSEPFISSRHTLDEAWENWPPTLEELNAEGPSQDEKEFIKALETVIKSRSTENAQEMADALSSTPGVVDGLRRTLRQNRLPKCCDPAQVLQVVQAVLQHDSYQITSLDISGNSEITMETLSEIFKLPKASEIMHLFLFGCLKVEDINRKDLAGRIGVGEGTEVFNSHLSYQD